MFCSIHEMRYNMWELMIDISFPITIRDSLAIESKNGMSVENMMDNIFKWSWQKSVLAVYDIQFQNGHPFRFRLFGFTDYNDMDIGDFVEFMYQMSFTHKVMYVEDNGRVFITESKDHQTNIDADLIEAMLNAYK